MGLMQSNDPRAERAREEHAQKMFDNSLSRNTRINYRSRVYKFQEMGYELPASPNDIVAFLNAVAKDLKSSTLMCYIKAIRNWHKINDFIDPTEDNRVKRFMAGVKKTYGGPPKKAKPFSMADMIKINKFLKERSDFNSVRNRALLMLGFFGAFRRSELVGMRLEHLTFSKQGLQILIPRSKTDQDGMGQTVSLPYMNDTDLCPVRALNQWLIKGQILSGYIWPWVNVNGIVRAQKHITPDAIYALVKQVAKDAELDEPELYSGHSLRRGFATEAAKRGSDIQSLMKHGRWESMQTVMGYIEQANNFQDNVLNLFNK